MSCRHAPVRSTPHCSILNVSVRAASWRPAFERIARPTLTEEGRRAPALRFGDPRVQALAGALCTTTLAVTGISEQEPARLDDRTARHCDLLDEPGQLRPGASAHQRPDHPHPRQDPLPTHGRQTTLC